MKKIIIILFSIAAINCLNAQTQPKIFLNHLFFVLDSSTFNNLFDDDYLQKIGDTSVKSTKTTSNSWSGKYLLGKQSYFEFFSSSGFKQTPEGGCGLGFMTYKSGDIDQIKSNWKSSTTDSVEADTMIIPNNGKLLPWFYDISLFTPDSLQSVSIWLMENTPDELKSVGFTDDEIKQPISWQKYSEKRHNKKFSKPFDHISNVEIITNVKEFDYLKKSLLGLGLKDDGKSFYNDGIKIRYTIAKVTGTKLKSATIELDESLPKNDFYISDHLRIATNGKTAKFQFNY